MSESSFFYSAITDGKKEFSKKLCFILNCGMLLELLTLWLELFLGIMLN